MKEYNYVTDLHVKVWLRLNLTIKANSKEEADTIIIQLAKEEPFSMDNGDENNTITNNEYLLDTEILVEGQDTVQVFDLNTGTNTYLPENAIYRNIEQSANDNLPNEHT